MSTAQGAADRRRLEMFRTLGAERLTRLNLGWIQLEQGEAEPGLGPELMRELHTLKGEAGLLGYSALASLCHQLEDLLRQALPSGGSDVTTGDRILRGFDLIAAAMASDDTSGAEVDGLAEFLAAGAATSQPAAAAESQPPSGPAASAVAPRPVPGLAAARPLVSAEETSLRVTAARLDHMRELVGELMLTRGRLELSTREFRRTRKSAVAYQEEISGKNQEAGRLFGKLLQTLTGIEQRLRDDQHRVSNLISELDGVVRELRMVPLSSLLRTYPVAVHALARELGREVRLEFEGDAVEVDRAVLDRLADPLLHLIRNAVDHGIEPPDVRLRAGKRREGTILLRAQLRGQGLEIEIRDDGAGIDVDAVRARSVELGFYDAATARALSEDQILRTLFQSGMTTRREVTKISGRGIGLDVVLRSVEKLGGTATLRSGLGRGTAIHLSVPLASALASMVLFEVGAGRYALPAASVVELAEATAYPPLDGIDGPAVRYGGMLVPLMSLFDLLDETAVPASAAPAEPQAGEQLAGERLMLVRSGRGLVALSGSQRHMQREVVQKAVGRGFLHNRLITAAIPLEEGVLSLVLSPGELLSDTGARPRRTVSAAAGEIASGSRGTRTVLVVDDSPVVRDLLAESLRAHGVRVLEASDGEEALLRLQAAPEIALMLTDIDMPKLDGIGLLTRVRARSGPRLPVVIVSMRASSEEQRRAIDAGADAYMVKTDLTHAGLWTLLARFLG